MRTILMIVVACVISTAAEARFDCGRTQARYFGVGSARALDWASDFQHVSAQVGAVVVQTRHGLDSAGHQGGHVSRIVQLVDQCHAVVADEKGQYTRDICSHLVAYVMPSIGGGAHSEPLRSRRTGHWAAPRERAQAVAYAPADRFAQW